MSLFERILSSRNISSIDDFLNPDYYTYKHDPFLLPDMDKAVDRLTRALKDDEKVTIYGDYDIDGLTSTTLMYEALKKFGFHKVETFIPNRFIEGFGLNGDAVEKIIKNGTSLILTVDCGSSSPDVVERAKNGGVDVIITDHHDVNFDLPKAIAVVNPKRSDSKYPFSDLAGVGVAFKLVQALQGVMNGLPSGQEKWGLDLVALGTVCDSVQLNNENRANVYWGIRVLSKTRRIGLKSLMKISNLDSTKINSQSLGFVLGPRMNAAGRLETAQYALDMLLTKNGTDALRLAHQLDAMNNWRRAEQDKIFQEASSMALRYEDDPVLVLSSSNWNHGIVGIAASKILERYKKPTFLLQEIGENTKGSARSYGDFSLSEAISRQVDIIHSGGGHKLAAGVSLATNKIDAFRAGVNEFYNTLGLNLANQQALLLPIADACAALGEVNESLIAEISKLEPFGMGNPRPILKTDNLLVVDERRMGSSGQHLKLVLSDGNYKQDFISFNAPDSFFVPIKSRISVWYQPDLNEWRGSRRIENKIVYLE